MNQEKERKVVHCHNVGTLVTREGGVTLCGKRLKNDILLNGRSFTEATGARRCKVCAGRVRKEHRERLKSNNAYIDWLLRCLKERRKNSEKIRQQLKKLRGT